MKRVELFTPCADCLSHVGGVCAEGRGQTTDKDGCIEIYNYDGTLSELEEKTILQKIFLKHKTDVTLCTASCRERQKHVLFRDLCADLAEKMQPDMRTLTPDILTAAGWKVDRENIFEKVLYNDITDEEFIVIRFYHRNGVTITQIDTTRDKADTLHVSFRRDITVGEFNNAVALVGLDQLKI